MYSTTIDNTESPLSYIELFGREVFLSFETNSILFKMKFVNMLAI